VLNEKIGVLESGQISTNSKLAELEVSVGRVDKKRSHTKSKSIVHQARTALANQGVPVNLTCKLTRKSTNHQIQERICWIFE